MSNVNNDADNNEVRKTKDVININAVDPDDKREVALTTTDFAEALSKDVDEHTPTLAAFPNTDNEEKNDEKENEK